VRPKANVANVANASQPNVLVIWGDDIGITNVARVRKHMDKPARASCHGPALSHAAPAVRRVGGPPRLRAAAAVSSSGR
jgi:hypothetical protein